MLSAHGTPEVVTAERHRSPEVGVVTAQRHRSPAVGVVTAQSHKLQMVGKRRRDPISSHSDDDRTGVWKTDPEDNSDDMTAAK